MWLRTKGSLLWLECVKFSRVRSLLTLINQLPVRSAWSLLLSFVTRRPQVTKVVPHVDMKPLRKSLRADAHLIGLENIPTSVSHRAGFGPASGCSRCIVPYGVTHTWLDWSAQSGSELMSMCEDQMNWAEDWSGLNFNEMFLGNCDIPYK